MNSPDSETAPSTALGVPGSLPTGWTRKPGDGWVDCSCGQRHWGKNGAAGLFLVRIIGTQVEVALQHRALWSHQGGTWSIPGGAIMDGETPHHAALREAFEEAGVHGQDVQVIGNVTMEHPEWKYTTFVALFAPADGTPASSHQFTPTDQESIEVRWINLDTVMAQTPDLPLLPAFGNTLDALREVLNRHHVTDAKEEAHIHTP